jgi:Rad3-related DNA helicase
VSKPLELPCRAAAAHQEVAVSFDELRAVAEALCDARRGDHLLRIHEVLNALVDASGDSGWLRIPAGATTLLSAPTGKGKSLLLRVLAVYLATTGRTITLVVPDAAAVIALTRELEADLAALASPASTAGLVSPNATMGHFARRATDLERDANETRWVSQRWAYACALSGAIDGGPGWPVGREPCRKCPLRSGCAKFAEQRRAANASVLIINHHNFVAGRLRVPMEVDGQAVENMAVSEFAFRRSDLVCVDEVDQLQATVASLTTSTLRLTLDQDIHPALQRLRQDAVAAMPETLRPAERRRFHAMWTHLVFLVTSYVTACMEELGPFEPRGRPRRRLVLPGRHDPVVALRLAGRSDDQTAIQQDFDLLYSLDDPAAPTTPADLARSGQLLAELVANADGADKLPAVQAELIEILADRIPDGKKRANTIDLLLHRAYLRAITGAVQRLSAQVGELRDAGLASQGDVEDGMGRLAGWQLSPSGLLGETRMAFSIPLPGDSDGDQELSVGAIGGDSHEYIAELGRALALSLTGVRRPVLGVSATAYLPGAATTHIHRPIRYAVCDDPAAPVSIALRHVIDSGGAPVRLSGLSARDRDNALAAMGAGLWIQHLDAHLSELRRAGRAERARVLLVANSYGQLADLADGIISAGCAPVRIAHAVPDDEAARRAIATPSRVTTVTMSRFAGVIAAHPECDVLLAPLSRVARGLNLVTGDGRSAISSIWLAIRPVPLVDEPDRLVAHAGAYARRTTAPQTDFARTLQERRAAADEHLRLILNSPPAFGRLPLDVRVDLTASVASDLIQLVGRARRGDTDAELNLVDGAFLGGVDGRDGWPAHIRELRSRWKDSGELPTLRALYGGTLDAVLAIADYGLDSGEGEC